MTTRLPPRPLDKGSLWLLIIAPTIWALHLLLSYVTGALWCGMVAGPGGALGSVKTAVVWYTAVALLGIAIVGIEGYRRHRFGTEANTRDLDSPEDRHRFLGFATLLLAGLSAVAVAYAAMAAAFFETCR